MAGDPDFLGMSDEEFLKTSPASGEPASTAEEAGSQTTETTQAEEPVVVETETEKPPVEVSNPHADDKPEATDDDTTDTTQTGKVDGEEDGEATETEVEGEATEAEAPDYEAFYKQIMTPFKANGRTVELKTPAEAVQLMQMGANYTKKMQELVPHRKLLTMLQNNGLMDEGKLSFLIDVEKKNPEAIKKLIKDSGIDPMEIDTSVEPAYHEGNHRVSDEEVTFQQTLEDMKSTPEQLGTLQVINGDWDQASKEALWKNPEIMTIIHEQRTNGVYDRINAELNRRRTLGNIPVNVPFLQAYKIVGDEMTAANAFNDLSTTSQKPQVQPPQVVTTRVAAPKAVVKNGERAAAASTNRQSVAKVKEPTLNPLAMSDEEFSKLDQFSGRL